MRARTTRFRLAPPTACAAGTAVAQGAAVSDPGQLPATDGKIAQYRLTTRGDPSGTLLDDGAIIRLPPPLGPIRTAG